MPRPVPGILPRPSGPVVVLSVLLTGAASPQGVDLQEPREIAFVAALDGTVQLLLERLPATYRPEAMHDAIIALHGHGADRHQYAANPRDECRAVRDVAARHGMILVSPDYRAPTSWMGPAAEADMLQIIAELRRRHRVRHIFLTGGSMGGSAALTFAALHPHLLAGVSSQNGTANHLEFSNFQDAIAASFGGGKEAVPEEYRRRSPELHAERLTMPVALTTGGRDQVVPPDSVLRLAADLEGRGRPVLLIHRPEGGHSTTYADTAAALEYVIGQVLRSGR